jgi:hypothetical protein
MMISSPDYARGKLFSTNLLCSCIYTLSVVYIKYPHYKQRVFTRYFTLKPAALQRTKRNWSKDHSALRNNKVDHHINRASKWSFFLSVESSPHIHTLFLQNYFDFISRYALVPQTDSLAFKFFDEFLYAFFFHFRCYMPCSSHLP